MKKIVLLALFTILVQTTMAWPCISIHYIAGQPDSRHVCVASGMCDLRIEFCWGVKDPNKSDVTGEMQLREGILVMVVPQKELPRDYYDNMFAGGIFRLAYDAALPSEVKRELKLADEFMIPAGSHKVVKTATTYEVWFK